MIVKSIKLVNWKNFKECDIQLQERCFIVGANASGKSNLLDCLRFLRDITKQGGGLQNAVAERGGITKIRCLAARAISNVFISITVGDNLKNIWRYELDIVNSGGGIRENFAKIKSEIVYSFAEKKNVLERHYKSQLEDEESLMFTHIEQVTANKDFRELYNFFKNIEYLNIIPQLVRESGTIKSSNGKEDFYGRNFLQRLAKMNEKSRNAQLMKISNLLEKAVPQLTSLTFTRDEQGFPHLEARYAHWRPKAGKQTETQFSDGTLRLIGFLFALLDSFGVLLLEEPEINLHPEIIKQLPEFIAGLQRRKKNQLQVLITTHSYDILNNEGISPAEVVFLSETTEGTAVTTGHSDATITRMSNSGITIANSVIPKTKPSNIHRFIQDSLDL